MIEGIAKHGRLELVGQHLVRPDERLGVHNVRQVLLEDRREVDEIFRQRPNEALVHVQQVKHAVVGNHLYREART